MNPIPSRRSLLLGLGAVLAAPAIVRAGVLMPIKSTRPIMAGVDLAATPSRGRMQLWCNGILLMEHHLPTIMEYAPISVEFPSVNLSAGDVVFTRYVTLL